MLRGMWIKTIDVAGAVEKLDNYRCGVAVQIFDVSIRRKTDSRWTNNDGGVVKT